MDNKKNHLTFIITGLNTGGAEMMLFQLLKHINHSLFECQVISITDVGAVGEKIRALGIPIKALGMAADGMNPLPLLKLIYWLIKEKPDLVQTWMYHADLLGGLAAWIVGIPVVWNIHNLTLHPDGKQKTKYVVNLCAFLSKFIPTVIITCSRAAKAYHINLGYQDSKFEVIPNGFDVNLFKTDPTASLSLHGELNLDDKTMIIGNVARFDPQKDHRTLVEAGRILLSDFPDVKFVLCGDKITWKNEELAGWINDAKSSSSFYLLGPRDDIAKIMPGFDLLVSSSAGEAFPVVLGEAMACGIACVATDVGDSGLIIGETGVVVPPGAPKLLAEGMLKLLLLPEHERRDLGVKARERVIENFNLPDIVFRYETVYQQVLGRI